MAAATGDAAPAPGGAAPAPGDAARVTFLVDGEVQGVGFRWWVRSRALELGLAGFARNLPDGRVEVCVQGEPAAVARMQALLQQPHPASGRPGHVTSTTSLPGPALTDLRDFGVE